MNWTKEQENAISIPVSDTIVSAAAGSGKTAVMAERIIRHLTGNEKTDIDKMLVVTYTSAAASEIKERVMKKITERLEETNDESLSNQLCLLGNSHFCTIHSFCLDLIRKYFYKLNLDPTFKIGDTTEIELLKTKAADSVLDDYYSLSDSVFLRLVKEYSVKSDIPIRELILSVYNFSRSMVNPEKWLINLSVSYTDTDIEIKKYLTQMAVSAAQYAIKLYQEGIRICETMPNEHICDSVLKTNLSLIVNAFALEDYDCIYKKLSDISFARIKFSKNDCDDFKNKIKMINTEAKKTVTDEICKKYITFSPAEISYDNKNVYEIVNKISEMALNLGKTFKEMKKERNIIDFSDFEHLALKLLQDVDGNLSDIARSVSEQFDEIYIDEYQDCNDIQNAIFKCISGESRGHSNVYCVGDMKQSIYRFRDANPLFFREKCDSYTLYDGLHDKKKNKVLLNSNFRSRDTILNFVNSIFNQFMSRECGEIDYNVDEALYYGGGYENKNPDTNSIDFDIIDMSNSFGDSEPSRSELSAIEAEAVHVGRKIKKMISQKYVLFDKKTGIEKNADYSDIVILLRSGKETSSVFEKVLTEMNIPVYSDNGGGYFDTDEIRFLICLLKIIDNPDDDISLVTVLKSPIFSFDEDMLLEIKMENRKASFYRSMQEYAKNEEKTNYKKANQFLNRISEYYEKSRYMETDEFICYLLNDIDYFAYLSLFPDGKLRKTNVRFLLHKAKEFEKTNFKGIFSFVRYIETIKNIGSSKTAKILSKNDNVVRIMSIHKSKGLEFPIVFVSCLGKKFNMMDAYGKFVYHKELGLGIDSVYKDKYYKVPTVNKQAIIGKIQSESRSEELRVLYVALTRPTEKLILTAALDKGAFTMNKVLNRLYGEKEKINPYIVSKCANFAETILLAAIRSDGYPRDFDDNLYTVSDGCKYNISLINESDIIFEKKSTVGKSLSEIYNGQTDNYDEINRKISFEYPFNTSSNIPGNVTVTELKKTYLENNDGFFIFDDVTLAVPESLSRENNINGVHLGTVFHTIMEHLDFSKPLNNDSAKQQIKEMVKSNIIDEKEFISVDMLKIYNFINSNIAKRMSENNARLKKEFSFKILSPAKDSFDINTNDELIIQGTVDAFFEDDDGSLVIVDYKTDKIINNNTSEIAKRYNVQLDYYAMALEKSFKKPVKEKILFLFDSGESINLT